MTDAARRTQAARRRTRRTLPPLLGLLAGALASLGLWALIARGLIALL